VKMRIGVFKPEGCGTCDKHAFAVVLESYKLSRYVYVDSFCHLHDIEQYDSDGTRLPRMRVFKIDGIVNIDQILCSPIVGNGSHIAPGLEFYQKMYDACNVGECWNCKPNES
jgi:hypothetical protein